MWLKYQFIIFIHFIRQEYTTIKYLQFNTSYIKTVIAYLQNSRSPKCSSITKQTCNNIFINAQL